MRAQRQTTVVAIALGLALVVTGCSSDGEAADAERSTTTGAGADASWTVQVGGTPSDPILLAGLALADTDVQEGEQLRATVGGDQLEGQASLEHCDAVLAGEADRVARHRADLLVGGRPLVTGEAVRYRPGRAEAALDELRQAIDDCPQGEPLPDPLGGPARSFTSESISEDRLGVAEDHVAVAVTTEVVGGDGADARQVVVVQRRGDVVVATSGYGDEAHILEVAAAAGARLAATDAAALGA